ncbi:MAG: carboxypeptidase-like regulatory domain-containing protein [bacterium]
MSGPAIVALVLTGLTAPPPLAAPVVSRLRAQKGPTITVRGVTRLEVEKIQRVPGGVMLTVQLIDADLNEGVPDKKIKLSISRGGAVVFRAVETTSKSGKAQVFLPHRSGEYSLKLDFAGDSLYVRAKPEARTVDLSKEALSLNIASPPRLDIAGRSLIVSVSARHHAGIPAVRIVLQILRGDRVERALEGVTGDDGSARFEIAPKSLGAPGELLLVARSAASRQFNAARTTQRLALYSRVFVTLKVSESTARLGRRVTISGTVKDARGPVPHGIVRILGNGRPLLITWTRSSGRFERTLELRRVGLGKHVLKAQFVPRTAWRQAGTSPPVLLTVEPAKPIPLAYYLVPAALTVLFLLGVLLVRKRPWRALRQRLQDRQEARRPEVGGIELGRKRSFRSLFAVDHLSVSGTVYDLRRTEPLTGATVYLRSASPGREDVTTKTNTRGEFEVKELAPGTYNLVATAPGFIPQSLMIELPHRGELHGMAIRLQSVRVRVMQIYATVIRHLLPEPELVRYWTPGESTHHILAHKSAPPPGLSVLTALTQRVYYSHEVPKLETVAKADELAQQAAAAEDARAKERG